MALTEAEIGAALDEYLDGRTLDGTLFIVNGEELVLFPRGEPRYDDGGYAEMLKGLAIR